MGLKPGYKKTEVGVIPEEWEVRPLAQITDPKRPIGYGIVQTGRRVTNGVRCVRVVDIENGRINGDDLITTSHAISTAYKRTLLAEGDLVIALRGKIGALAVIEKDLIGANLTRGVALLAPLDGYDSKYLCHYLSSQSGRQVFEKNLNGSALQEIPIATLRKIPAVIPPLPEQRAIAGALSDVDSLIGALIQLIAKKRDLKQAAMQQLLTGETRLPGFTGEWEVKRLGQLCRSITDGTHYTPAYVSDGVPFYSVENVTADNFTQTKFITRQAHNLLIKRCKPEKGDILLTRIGSLGDTKLIDWNVDASIYVSLALLKPGDGVDTRYLYGYTKHRQFVEDVEARSLMNAAPKKINMGEIGSVPIRLPPLREQTAIAAVLSDMDAELGALEQRRDKTRALKQGMMQELLTGRTRLV